MSTIISPFDEIIDRLFEYSRKYAGRQRTRLQDLTQSALKQLLAPIHEKSKKINDTANKLYDNAIAMGKEMVKGSHICIEVESDKIRSAKSSPLPMLIPGKAKFTPPGSFMLHEVDCYVAYGHWDKLGPLKAGKINIVDRLSSLLPSNQTHSIKKPLGLVTFQNGIMNDFENDFKKMSQAIIDHFPEGPLCIGLHNPTTNILPLDMYRFIAEPNLNRRSVYSLCQMVKTFAELIPTINPNLVWTHFAHSEGGLILNAVLELLDQLWYLDTRKCIKKNLITATYGAVKPVPTDYVLEAVNTYSNRDIALFFGNTYLDKRLDQIKGPNYTSKRTYKGRNYQVTIVESKTISNPLLNIKLEMPKVLTVEEHLNMTWYERIARVEEQEGFPHLERAFGNRMISTVNDTAFAIDDHGFIQATYQAALRDDVTFLKKLYQTYEPKKSR